MLKTVLNSALVAIDNAKTSAAITGNAATVATLTTPESTTQPKSTISAKLANALAIMGANSLLIISMSEGKAIATTGANVKTWAGVGVNSDPTPIATVVADSVSSDGLRARFELAAAIAGSTDDYAKPTNADEDLQQLIDAAMPVRPMLSFDKAIAMFASYAKKIAATNVLIYDQQSGVFSYATKPAGGVLTDFPASPDATTVVFSYTEDADTVPGTTETPQFGG